MQITSPVLKTAFEKILFGRIAEGISEISKGANEGDVECIYGMGLAHRHGVGVERSASKARSWWMKAAERGHADSMLQISEQYATGDGVASDLAKAIEYCEKAVAAGETIGWVMIGLIHENGEYGAKQDPVKAFTYFSAAAERGDARAMFHLSRCYINGIGTSQNRERAFALAESSAQGRDYLGLEFLGYLCLTGFEGYPEDRRRAHSLYRSAAREGNLDARKALKQFPPVLELGAIACSPGFGRLANADINEIISRHKSGNWGDVTPEDWDANDAAVESGGIVRSIHSAPSMTVLAQTEGDRRTSYFEIADEEPESMTFSQAFESLHKAYKMWQFLRSILPS